MEPQPVAVIGASLDLGAGRRGVDMGPSAIRYAGLDARIRGLGRAYHDRGNVEGPVVEIAEQGSADARYVADIVTVCEGVADQVAASVATGALPVVLGGDHSVALGTVGGMARLRGPGGALWIDAHGDLNTPETSPSGNVHGMVLAAALGLGGNRFASAAWPRQSLLPQHVALLGTRELDPGERALIDELGILVLTMSDIDRIGIADAMNRALVRVLGAAFAHVSLDLDVVDPEQAPGVGTPVPGGFSFREAHLAMEIVAEWGQLDSLDVVEVNPILDRENRTGRLAVELVASALGARIL